MKIFLASDHAGFELKNTLKIYLEGEGYEVTDMGPYEYDEADDYPDFMHPVAEEISKDSDNNRGIIMGGSGQGEAMVANRLKGVRAAVYYGGNLDIIKLSREHNNANVLALGARFINNEEAKKAVKLWLETSFPVEERHVRRINKIDAVNF